MQEDIHEEQKCKGVSVNAVLFSLFVFCGLLLHGLTSVLVISAFIFHSLWKTGHVKGFLLKNMLKGFS